MKFRGWYIPIWIAGLSCLFYGFTGSWFVSIIGLIIIAVPFVLWFAVKPKAKQEKAKVIEETKEEVRRESVLFKVENVAEHQKVLKKVYKIQEDGDILDMPSCVLYRRGTVEEPEFAVYLGSDRIGDAEKAKCKDIEALIDKGELSGIVYVINEEYDAGVDDLVYDCVANISVKVK